MIEYYRHEINKYIEKYSKWPLNIDHTLSLSFDISTYGISLYITILSFIAFDICFPIPNIGIQSSEKSSKKILKRFHFRLSKHKSFMVQIEREPYIGIGFNFHHSIHRSHAGILLEIKFLLFTIAFDICDWRRWDHEKCKWKGIDDNTIQRMFRKYHQNWINEISSFDYPLTQQINNENYKNIIAIGKDVVPHIIDSLQKKPTMLFEALSQIVQEEYDPIKPEHQGDINKMAEDWLEWWDMEGCWIDNGESEIISIQGLYEESIVNDEKE
jgi:hypothetical protein